MQLEANCQENLLIQFVRKYTKEQASQKHWEQRLTNEVSPLKEILITILRKSWQISYSKNNTIFCWDKLEGVVLTFQNQHIRLNSTAQSTTFCGEIWIYNIFQKIQILKTNF